MPARGLSGAPAFPRQARHHRRCGVALTSRVWQELRSAHGKNWAAGSARANCTTRRRGLPNNANQSLIGTYGGPALEPIFILILILNISIHMNIHIYIYIKY